MAVTLPTLKELLESGAHFGHSAKRYNPKMHKFIYTVRNGVHIFDLVKTRSQLESACNYLEEALAKNAKILLVGTKAQSAELVRTEAVRLGIPYITNRWVGGLFTNWDQIKKRVEKLVDMKKKEAAGEYKKYTKKEQVVLRRDIERMERMYGGLVGMNELPSILFVVDPTREVTAVHEAKACNMTIVAIADSNCNPEGIAHIIPANDDALNSVILLVTTVLKAIEAGLKLGKKSQVTPVVATTK